MLIAPLYRKPTFRFVTSCEMNLIQVCTVCICIFMRIMINMLKSSAMFPVELELTQVKRFMYGSTKRIISKFPKWKTANVVEPIGYAANYAVVTGKRSEITVIDYSYNHDLNLDKIRTLTIRTPSGGLHFVFKYESSLQTIYNIMPNISVINDNGCMFSGAGYRVDREAEIGKIPQDLLERLEQTQLSHPSTQIDDQMYDLMSILPYYWFNEEKFVEKLVHVFRNSLLGDDICKATMGKLILERSDVYNEPSMLLIFDKAMNSRDKQFGIAKLKNHIRDRYPEEYNQWLMKWDTKRVQCIRSKQKLDQPKFVSKSGSCLKLSEIKALDPQMSSQRLLKDGFTTRRLNICKTCRNLHRTGCCKDYERKNRSSCMFVQNIALA